jgi:hypothetical protein
MVSRASQGLLAKALSVLQGAPPFSGHAPRPFFSFFRSFTPSHVFGSPAGPPGPPGAVGVPNTLPPVPPAPVAVGELTPDSSRSSASFTNPLDSRPTFVSAPRPAASFDRASSEYINFGSQQFSPGTTGVSFISAFSFTGPVGSWERVYDFGSGPASNNFVLARQGTSNNLIMFCFVGPNGSPIEMSLPGFIQQNQIIVSVVTCVAHFKPAFKNNLPNQSASGTHHQVPTGFSSGG